MRRNDLSLDIRAKLREIMNRLAGWFRDVIF